MRTLQKEEASEIALSDANPLHLAKVALQLGDLTSALEYWNSARTRYPTYVKQAPVTIEVLLGLKLFEEAEAMMMEGQKHAPREARYAEGYALVAEHRGDLVEATDRWRRVRRRFPRRWTAYVNAGRCLRELGRLEDAEVLINQATSRFPANIQAWLEFARIAEATRDWKQALSRWRQVSERFHHVFGVVGEARAMIALGQLDDAETYLQRIKGTFWSEPDVGAQLAQIAELRGDVSEAIIRWADVRRRFPTFAPAYDNSARLLRLTGDQETLGMVLIDAARYVPSEALSQIAVTND